MKKHLLLILLSFSAMLGIAQMATVNQQTITNVYLDTIADRISSLRTAGYNQATASNQATQTTSLGVINTSLATLATTVGVNTTTLAIVKQKNDTIAQNTRATVAGLATVASTVGVNTATLAIVKQKNDTIAQNTRAINSAVTGTLSAFTYNKIYKISTSVTTSTASYSSGDNIGGIITLTNVARYTAGQAELYDFEIWDNENQKPNLTIDFYSASPSGTYTDNAAQVMTGDGGVWLGSISVTSEQFTTTGGIARYKASISLLTMLMHGSASRNYFMTITTTSTPTYSNANGLIIKTGFKQD